MGAKSRRIKIEPHPDPKKREKGEQIKALALDFEITEEHWSVYELEDGTKVRMRVTAVGFTRALDFQTEQPIFDPKGTPTYGVQMHVETVFEPSENAMKQK